MRKLKPDGEELDDKRSSKANGIIKRLIRFQLVVYDCDYNSTIFFFVIELSQRSVTNNLSPSMHWQSLWLYSGTSIIYKVHFFVSCPCHCQISHYVWTI